MRNHHFSSSHRGAMAGLESYEIKYRLIEEEVYRGKYTKPGYSNMHNKAFFISPLDVPVVHPLAEDRPCVEDDCTVKKYIGLGCGLVSLITENLLIHPFIVLRRQCQVNPGSSTYHIIPLTLVPVVVRLHQTQGINTLWKGIGSVLLVRGMTLAIEDLISKIRPWPKELTCNTSLKGFGQHILLKCVSIGLVTPFYSASLVETVQSEIASERPGILDVFRDGALRLVEVGNKGRLIPMYSLLPPTIAYGVSKYLFTLIVRRVTRRVMHIRQKHSQELTGAYSRDALSEVAVQEVELRSELVSMFVADVFFYPLETVIHRLHIQGTRTIIDDLDTGRSVTPLLTGYSGASDCYATIMSTEGPLGFYKGFGALLLQFAMHVVMLRATKWILTELGTIIRPKSKSKSARARPSWHEYET